MATRTDGGCCSPSRGSTAGVLPPPEITLGESSGSTAGMVALPGGEFVMGSDDRFAYPDEGEAPREFELSAFMICRRYRVAARQGNEPTSSTGNLGFRCAADA
jgi:sulfatase modifying factor 1